MTEATRRLNQLEAGLEKIKDPVVREAMTGLLEYVQSIAGSGVETRGKMTATDGISVGSGFSVTKQGDLKAHSLETDDGGKLKFIFYKGILEASDTVQLPAPNGLIVGVIGWAKLESVVVWGPITRGSITNGIYTTGLSNLSTTSTLGLLNGSSTEDLPYRVAIFYQENE